MPLNLFTNFEIQKHDQNDAQLNMKNKPKINDVYSRNNLPKIKDGAYAISPDEYQWIITYWTALHVNGNNWRASYNAVYFDSFGMEDISKEIKKFIVNKIVKYL